LIDRCVCHAIEGVVHISEIQINVQYTVLQAALILTITANLYITLPVSFDQESMAVAFSCICGIAAFTHLLCIVNCTILVGILNMAYSDVDKMIAYHKTQKSLQFTFALNYIAVISTVVVMLIAGYNRSSADNAVQIYAVLIVIYLIISFIRKGRSAEVLQDERALRFYQKYCDMSGELKNEYLKLLHPTTSGQNKTNDDDDD